MDGDVTLTVGALLDLLLDLPPDLNCIELRVQSEGGQPAVVFVARGTAAENLINAAAAQGEVALRVDNQRLVACAARLRADPSVLALSRSSTIVRAAAKQYLRGEIDYEAMLRQALLMMAESRAALAREVRALREAQAPAAEGWEL